MWSWARRGPTASERTPLILSSSSAKTATFAQRDAGGDADGSSLLRVPAPAAAPGAAASAAAGGQRQLKRSLGTLDLTAIGVGGIIGAGIYVLTGEAAARYAGPAIVLSFVFSGVACTFAALCYSELGAMIPSAGSAYTFTSIALGQLPGFIIGWDLVLEYAMGAATVATGWSGYAVSLLADMGVTVPRAIASAPIDYDPKTDSWVTTGGVVNVPAICVIAVMTLINVRGVRESALFNCIVVAIKLGVLLIFIAAGAVYVDRRNWSPFIPPEQAPGTYGWTGVMRGSAVVFFSYIGFDSISTAAQEARDPQRSLPIATITSLLLCTGLYVVVGLILTGLVPYAQLDVADPIAVAVNAGGEGLRWLRPIVKVGAIFGLTSVIMVLVMGQARIAYAMAADGMLPPALARVHPRYATPYVTTLLTGSFAAVVAGLLPIGVLGEMVSIGTLAAFIVVCGGVVVLRRTSPELRRPFRAPFSPWVPALGVLTSAAQMVSLPLGTWLRFVAWLLIGLVVYFSYSRRHARPWAERRAEALAAADALFREHAGAGADGADGAAEKGGDGALVADDAELVVGGDGSPRLAHAAAAGDDAAADAERVAALPQPGDATPAPTSGLLRAPAR